MDEFLYLKPPTNPEERPKRSLLFQSSDGEVVCYDSQVPMEVLQKKYDKLFIPIYSDFEITTVQMVDLALKMITLVAPNPHLLVACATRCQKITKLAQLLAYNVSSGFMYLITNQVDEVLLKVVGHGKKAIKLTIEDEEILRFKPVDTKEKEVEVRCRQTKLSELAERSITAQNELGTKELTNWMFLSSMNVLHETLPELVGVGATNVFKKFLAVSAVVGTSFLHYSTDPVVEYLWKYAKDVNDTLRMISLDEETKNKLLELVATEDKLGRDENESKPPFGII